MSSNGTWLSLLEEKKIEARDSFGQGYSPPAHLNSDSSFRAAFEKLCERKKEYRPQRLETKLINSCIPITELAKAVHESISDLQDLGRNDTLEALIWWTSFGLIEASTLDDNVFVADCFIVRMPSWGSACRARGPNGHVEQHGSNILTSGASLSSAIPKR